MRTTDADRELAMELADMFGLDEQALKMLIIVLRSHRQLPADMPEQKLCGTISSASGNSCVLPAGHYMSRDRPHQVADGRWF